MLGGLNPKTLKEEQHHHRGMMIPVSSVEVRGLPHCMTVRTVHTTFNFLYQAISSNTWYIPSFSGISTNGYLVTNVTDSCAECTDSMLCKKGECKHLCRHMYLCSCYDYNNGHLCKHIHRVHSSIGRIVPPESDESDSSTEQQKTQQIEPMDDGSNRGHTPAVEIATEAIQPNHHKTGFDNKWKY